jgi:hypothetical protein
MAYGKLNIDKKDITTVLQALINGTEGFIDDIESEDFEPEIIVYYLDFLADAKSELLKKFKEAFDAMELH